MNILNFYKKKNNNKKKDNNIYYNHSDVVNNFMLRVYLWMCLGLFITSFSSILIYKFNKFLNFILYDIKIFILLFFLQIFIIYSITSLLKIFSEKFIIFLFILYSILVGINLSTIFKIYSSFEIFYSFISTFITFILMSLYGYITKNDLTKIGNLLLMIFVGILISYFVNSFFKNSLADLTISCISVLLFTLLISYDTQKLKLLGSEMYYNDNNLLNKYSMLGALILYLDFLNLFILILKLIKKKDK